MRLVPICLALALLPGIFLSSVARAQKPATPAEQRAACDNKSGHESPDAQIAACSALIDAGNEKPNNLSVDYNNRGKAYAAKDDEDRALKDFEQAIAAYPTNATAIYNRAAILLHRDRLDEALAGFDQTIKLDPHAFPAYVGRGDVLLQRHHYRQAIVDLNQAIALNPNNARAYNLRAIGYRELGKYDLALRDHGLAIKLDPKNFLYWNGRCWTRVKTNALGWAMADCSRAMELKPGDPHVLDSLGFVYLKMGQNENAIEKFTASLKDDPNRATSLYGRGIARLRKGDESGKDDIAAATKLQPDIADEMSRIDVGVKADPPPSTATRPPILPSPRPPARRSSH